jgi:hypothetical protein
LRSVLFELLALNALNDAFQGMTGLAIQRGDDDDLRLGSLRRGILSLGMCGIRNALLNGLFFLSTAFFLGLEVLVFFFGLLCFLGGLRLGQNAVELFAALDAVSS